MVRDGRGWSEWVGIDGNGWGCAWMDEDGWELMRMVGMDEDRRGWVGMDGDG